ncbi:MAG: peptidylprolyl isomerase [Planctomycetes bacterium]|nr:peptidylprolyl isomerase [Planctomycetota bacterium]
MNRLPVHPTPKPRRLRWIWMLLSGLAVVAVALLIRFGLPGRQAEADGPQRLAANDRSGAATAKSAAGPKQPASVVAVVDGQQLSREALAAECLKYHGREVLGSVTNKHLIVQHCQKRGIVISQEELDKEIQQIARRFGVPVDQWLTMLEAERGISAEHYTHDIIWPTIALRKLAANQLQVTDDEVAQEFESRFGPRVQIRLISVGNRKQADEVHAMATAAPNEFARLAGKYSNDVDSASAGGMIPPVRRYAGDPQLERIAFGLQPGEVSDVIPVNSQFLILKCEKHLPGNPPNKGLMSVIEKDIHTSILDRKLRSAGSDLFKELQKTAEIRVVMNDPAESRRMPGVAATVNGQPITLAQLAEECVARHGREVLHRMITRTIVANALKRQQVAISEAELDAEIGRAATAAGVVTKSGAPDIERWTKIFTQQQQVSDTSYRNDIVWPTVALKKLVADKVKLTEADMRNGFEANYGPRVRCRVIVMDNHRRAQQVWDMARRDPSLENFGRLAAEYSVEPGSKALDGQVPPIQMHGGQPALEKEAFGMKPGEISGVIALADKFVILFCEGRTKPVVVEMAEVAKELQSDLHEKKFRVAMAQEFERLQEAAEVENMLDPKASHHPSPKDEAAPGSNQGIATRPTPATPVGGPIRK